MLATARPTVLPSSVAEDPSGPVTVSSVRVVLTSVSGSKAAGPDPALAEATGTMAGFRDGSTGLAGRPGSSSVSLAPSDCLRCAVPRSRLLTEAAEATACRGRSTLAEGSATRCWLDCPCGRGRAKPACCRDGCIARGGEVRPARKGAQPQAGGEPARTVPVPGLSRSATAAKHTRARTLKTVSPAAITRLDSMCPNHNGRLGASLAPEACLRLFSGHFGWQMGCVPTGVKGPCNCRHIRLETAPVSARSSAG